ncbi:Autophagy-related protein 9 [Colletotrichum sp. SAR11_239]|nr:Autophagy-related protein 9 [Colletotrichum sp. SAR11_239]
MASNIFSRLGPPARGSRSFYEELRGRRDEHLDIEDQAGLDVDEENLKEQFQDYDLDHARDLAVDDSRTTLDSNANLVRSPQQTVPRGSQRTGARRDTGPAWLGHEEDGDNDVPASLLVEPHEVEAGVKELDRRKQPVASTQQPAIPVDLRRLRNMRNFYTYLLEIPEEDMQTVSWQDIVSRVMSLRDANPKTAINITPSQRRWIRNQSKERLDAHDIANRLMRRENYLIAMMNKDVLNLTLPIPFMGKHQFFSRSLEWNLHFSILGFIFDESNQVNQEFLKADRRGQLSAMLKTRLMFAGFINLLIGPFVVAYLIIVHALTYYNEYQKDPGTFSHRRYTPLAEWKFREFNELPHLFQERLNMSYPAAHAYIDQFPKRLTEQFARSVTFIAGAITSVLAIASFLEPEHFLGFELLFGKSALFYIGVFAAAWAAARSMISEETTVFNPEYALRNVISFIHYMPAHWEARLHTAEVKREFSELYKLKVLILVEEIVGILTASLVLIFSAPKCSDQIIDFFREFTIHVDGVGYVCSFAVFDFKKGAERAKSQVATGDKQSTRRWYGATKPDAKIWAFIDCPVADGIDAS